LPVHPHYHSKCVSWIWSPGNLRRYQRIPLCAINRSECLGSWLVCWVLAGQRQCAACTPSLVPGVHLVAGVRLSAQNLEASFSEAAVCRVRLAVPSGAGVGSGAKGLPAVSSEKVAGTTRAGSAMWLPSGSCLARSWSSLPGCPRYRSSCGSWVAL
jgi:hypothetical protein